MEESVRGIIIGDVTFPYQFWTEPDEFGFQQPVAKGFFVNDEEAIAWIKAKYPDAFAAGLEMRVFEGG